MLTLIRNLALIPRLVQSIALAVAAVEAVTSNEVGGPDKKRLVIASLGDILGKFKGQLGDGLYSSISEGIDIIVRIFNLLGIFKRDAPSVIDPITDEPVGASPEQVEAGVSTAARNDPELDEFLTKFKR